MSIGTLLNQTLTLYNKSSYDTYGRPQVGSGTDIDCRFQPKQTRKVLVNGDVIVIDALAYVPADTTINTDDKVSYDSVIYKVFSKYPTPDGKGNTAFIRLELMKWEM